MFGGVVAERSMALVSRSNNVSCAGSNPAGVNKLSLRALFLISNLFKMGSDATRVIVLWDKLVLSGYLRAFGQACRPDPQGTGKYFTSTPEQRVAMYDYAARCPACARPAGPALSDLRDAYARTIACAISEILQLLLPMSASGEMMMRIPLHEREQILELLKEGQQTWNDVARRCPGLQLGCRSQIVS